MYNLYASLNTTNKAHAMMQQYSFSKTSKMAAVDRLGLLYITVGVPWRQPHRRSGLATLPFVGAVP